MSTMPFNTPYVPTYRLTRRGRLAVLSVALLVVLAIGIALSGGSAAIERPAQPEPTLTVTVGTGETLWGIAAEASEGADVRDMMATIEQLNALETPVLQAGQQLLVPLG